MKKVVYIRYLDSVMFNTGEYTEDHEFKLVEFDAVGFLIKEDDKAVYISREVNTTFLNKRRAVLGIPKIAILERKNLKF